MMNKFKLVKEVLLWLSTILAVTSAAFLVVGYEACYSSSFCYEMNSIFGISNYAIELFTICVAIALAALYSKVKLINSNKWLVFTVVWVPSSLWVSMSLSGGTNGWIPTSFNSSYLVALFSVLYLIISVVLLRSRHE